MIIKHKTIRALNIETLDMEVSKFLDQAVAKLIDINHQVVTVGTTFTSTTCYAFITYQPVK
jgi:hypothetical protein